MISVQPLGSLSSAAGHNIWCLSSGVITNITTYGLPTLSGVWGACLAATIYPNIPLALGINDVVSCG